jgi:hypothetical protein
MVNQLNFRELKQFDDEPFDDFVKRVRDHAKTCDFGTSENQEIAMQILQLCRSKSLKGKILSMDKYPELSELIRLARVDESVTTQVDKLESRREVIVNVDRRCKPTTKARNATNVTPSDTSQKCARSRNE